MQAWRLLRPGPLPEARFELSEVAPPQLGADGAADDLLLHVRACAVCHTDLHIVEGDLPPRRLPLTPGHQVIATVQAVAPQAQGVRVGDRVGVPWLHATCGVCAYCRAGQENLCDRALFTGWDTDGGYAEFVLARAAYVVPIPAGLSDLDAAPLLCAGIIGYRSLRQAQVQPGEHLGLFGFGASAHLAIQVAHHWHCRVSVFTRSRVHQALAAALGAEWTGTAEQAPPTPLDRAVIFAPAGSLVPLALARLRKGGALAINAIHMSPIPELDYNLLYGERTVCSVANATRRDAIEFMELASQIPLSVEVEPFALEAAADALRQLRQSRIKGAAVLLTSAAKGVGQS